MASPAGCSGYRCESPPCTEPCPTSVVPVHRPHLSTAWLPSVHPPGRPGRRGRSARGAAASGLTNTTCGGSSLHEGSVRRRGGRLRKEPDSPRGAGPEARDVAHGAGRTTVLAGGAPARGADRNVAQSASSLEDEFGPIRELRPGRTMAYSHSAPARAPRAPSVYGPAASAIA